MHPAIPLVHWGGVRYSVTPACIGHQVAYREEVDSGVPTITWAGRDMGPRAIVPSGSS